MKKFDVQAEVYVWGERVKRTIYTDGSKFFIKWYGEYVEVKRNIMSYSTK